MGVRKRRQMKGYTLTRVAPRLARGRAVVALASTARQTRLYSSSTSSPLTATRMEALSGGNLFAEFSALAVKHSSANLGQGFPSFGAPPFLARCVRSVPAGPPCAHPHPVLTPPL